MTTEEALEKLEQRRNELDRMYGAIKGTTAHHEQTKVIPRGEVAGVKWAIALLKGEKG